MSFATRSFLHRGHRLFYDDYGEGETGGAVLVYLHGLLLDSDINRGIARRRCALGAIASSSATSWATAAATPPPTPRSTASTTTPTRSSACSMPSASRAPSWAVCPSGPT